MAKITYANKVALNPQPSISEENKVTDTDMNEIKTSVNTLYDNQGDLSSLATTDKSSMVNAINELKNAETYSTSEIKTNKVWIDGKPIYSKVIIGTLPTTNYSTFITIANLDTPISENILITMADNSKLRLPFANLINNKYCDYYIIGNNYYVHFSVDEYKSRPFVAIVEYTKTTD